jgi:hypothetical protein
MTSTAARPVRVVALWGAGLAAAGLEAWASVWFAVLLAFGLGPSCRPATTLVRVEGEAILVLVLGALLLPWVLVARSPRYGALGVVAGIVAAAPTAYFLVVGLGPRFWDGYCF